MIRMLAFHAGISYWFDVVTASVAKRHRLLRHRGWLGVHARIGTVARDSELSTASSLVGGTSGDLLGSRKFFYSIGAGNVYCASQWIMGRL